MPVVHNKGRKIGEKTVARKIIFAKHYDEHGKPKANEHGVVESETLNPGAHMKVSAEALGHLKELFGDEIVNVDDISDMQRQFAEAPAEKMRESGYVAADDVEKLVQKRVAEELAKKQGGGEPGAKNAGGAQEKAPATAPANREELIEKLDSMDRGDLVAFIEQNALEVKADDYKRINGLKAAVLEAFDEKQKAAS